MNHRIRVLRSMELLLVVLALALLLSFIPSTQGFLTTQGQCPLLILLPFSAVREYSAERLYAHLASAILAIQHFNERNSQIIAELGNKKYAEECTIQIPLVNASHQSSFFSIIADDGDDTAITTRAIFDYYVQQSVEALPDIIDTPQSTSIISRTPCAIVGSLTNQVAQTAAAVARALDTPYITHAADFFREGQALLNPMSIRMSASEATRANVLMEYLKNYRNRDYVYAIHDSSAEISIKAMNQAAKHYDATFRSILVAPPYGVANQGLNSIHDAMRQIKESGFKTIIVSVSHVFLWNHIYREAEIFGLTGKNGFVWISYDTSDLEEWTSRTYVPDSPTDKVLRGAGAVHVLDGYQWNPEDKFLTAWREQGGEFRRLVNSLHPIHHENGIGYFQPEDDDYFRTNDPQESSHVSFLYDAIMSVGIGACNVEADMRKRNNNRTLSKHTRDTNPALLPFSRNDHFNAIVASRYNGASGYVRLDGSLSFSREASHMAFGAYNIRPSGVIDPSTGSRRYEYVLTSIKLPGENWKPLPETRYIFADGTSNEPMPLRDIFENNYLTPTVRILGLSLMGISLLIGFGSLVWIFMYRKSPVVRAAQPEFLALVSVGSIITSLSTLMLSFDERQGWSESQLDRACMAAPWLFVLGYVVAYSALFSKLLRLDYLLQIRHVKLTAWQAMGPVVVLVITSVVILTMWTIMDPYRWNRETIDNLTGETLGMCDSERLATFMAPLVGVMVLATLLAGCYAWRCKDVSEDFSEAKWIFYAIFAQLQVWVIGIPIIMLVKIESSINALYMGMVLVIWSFSVSIVLLIVGPRVIQLHVDDKARLSQERGNTARDSVCRRPSIKVSGLGKDRVLTKNAMTVDRASGPPSDAHSSKSAGSHDKSTLSTIELVCTKDYI